MTHEPLSRLIVRIDPADLEMVELAATQVVGTGFQEITQPDGAVDLVFWVSDAAAESTGHLLRAITGVREVTHSPQDDAWKDAHRAFHQPVVVSNRLRVRPPWVEADPDIEEVVIDPGMAFGTGQHATTKGCLELLCGVPLGSLTDVGCGSGVLSIAARRLGFVPVSAIDFDPLCIQATVNNARENGVALAISRREVGRDPVPRADVVVANLTSGLLRVLAEQIKATTRDVVISGFRPDEADEVRAAWEAIGFREVGRRETEEWCAMRMTRPG